MFFILSKTLTIFLMPMYWLVALLLLWIFSRKRKRFFKRAFIVGFFFLSNALIINSLLLAWEISPTPLKDIKVHEVGIVLTGVTQTQKTPTDRVYLADGADRIMHALMLYRQGKIKKILITGGNITILGEVRQSEASQLKQILLDAQVPKEDIILEENARNTRENALFSKTILQKDFPKKRYLLITSAFHMRRSLGCFERVGIAVTPFSAGVHTRDFIWGRMRDILWELLPNERALYLWYILVHEILGYIVYKTMGYA